MTREEYIISTIVKINKHIIYSSKKIINESDAILREIHLINLEHAEKTIEILENILNLKDKK